MTQALAKAEIRLAAPPEYVAAWMTGLPDDAHAGPFPRGRATLHRATATRWRVDHPPLGPLPGISGHHRVEPLGGGSIVRIDITIEAEGAAQRVLLGLLRRLALVLIQRRARRLAAQLERDWRTGAAP